MSTSECIVCAILGGVFFSSAYAQETPELGKPVSEKELDELDYTVMPDGVGLPDGSGDAIEGEAVYEKHCAACHGASGTGGINDILVGGQGSLATDRPVKTVGSYWPYGTTLFDYIRRAMPYPSPGVLSNSDVYAVTAYILFLNDIIPRDSIVDAERLPAIQMPNRDNFDWAYPEAK